MPAPTPFVSGRLARLRLSGKLTPGAEYCIRTDCAAGMTWDEIAFGVGRSRKTVIRWAKAMKLDTSRARKHTAKAAPPLKRAA